MIIEKLLIVLVAILPFQFALNVGTNVDLVITRVLVPFIFLLWLARSLAKRKIWVASRAETWLLLIFLFFAALFLIAARNPVLGERKLLYLFSLAPLYFVAADILQKDKWRIAVTRSFVWSGLLAAAVSIFQFSLQFILGINQTLALWQKLAKFFLGASFSELVLANSSWLVNISGKTVMRAFGFFPDPHVFSFFVSMCFFITLGYAVGEKNKKWQIFSLVSGVLMFCATLLSFARGAYIGLIVAGIFFLFVYFKRSGNLSKLLLASAVLAAVVAIFFSGSIESRLLSAFNPGEGSNSERILNWGQALALIEDSPWTGVGLGNYSHAIDPLAPERSSIYAHNIYLDIAAEMGIATSLVFFSLLLAAFLKNIGANNMPALGFAAALLYFCVHGVFDTPIYAPQVFALLLVVLAAAPALSKKVLRKI